MGAAEKLLALRKRTGLSRQAFARHLGYRSAAGYYRYEDPNQNSSEHVPAHLLARLRRLIGQGAPPITPDDITALAPVAISPSAKLAESVTAAYARLGSALTAGELEAASAHCQVLMGEIALLRLHRRG